MTGRNTTKTLVAEAFGEEFELRTAAPYEWAGVIVLPILDQDFPRRLVAKGTSKESVTKRTRTENNTWRPNFLKRFGRSQERNVLQVVRLFEATAPTVREYFSTHRVVVSALFRADLDPKLRDASMGNGWTTPQKAGYATTFRACRAGRSDLRRLAADGWTAVGIRQFDGGSGRPVADFQMDELIRSMGGQRMVSA